MDRQTKRLVVGSAALALVGWLVSPLLASRASEMIAIAEAPIHFNAARAIDLARQFVARFPSRALGSIEARQSTGFFREVLEPLGYSIEYTHFDATVEGRRQVGRNVLARRPGRLRETVAVVAHYDTTRTAVEGASDNGAAVGVLLELARVFSEETPQHSLLFLASDGGQWGMLGAADLAAGYPGLKDIVAAVSLDGISPGEIDRLSIGTDGLAAGYAPPWLRSLARSALLAEGPGVSEAFGLREHVERAFLLPGSDQGPLLARGIPAVNLDSLSSGRGRMARALLSSEDTIDQIRVATVEKFGRASERLLRSLDTLDPMPDDSMGAFQVIPGRYLSPGLVVLLQGVCFLPFLLAMRGYWREHNDRLSFELIRWETSWYLATWAPFLVAYGALLISYRMGLLPQFDLYPPPPGDPVMENPSWGIVAIILLSGIVSAAVFYLLGRLLTRKITKPEFHSSKLIMLMVFSAILVSAFLHNKYWASAFMLLPSLAFSMVDASPARGGRWYRRLLIAAAAFPYIGLAVRGAVEMGVGWNVLWMQVLALGTGMFGTTGFVVASAAVAVGIRLIAAQSAPAVPAP